mmetsp:Transcript_5865/g.15055  ORF Transcript_5865/g.15055 Transcript_5865/m.15055 type:complete len:266 (+) Transcript_5865:1021-1818(+)
MYLATWLGPPPLPLPRCSVYRVTISHVALVTLHDKPLRFMTPAEAPAQGWEDRCIANMRAVGFLRENKGRPNPECPAGWFLCRGLCYTLVQRNSAGPTHGAPDYDGLEARCGLCGGARVAFVGSDPGMQAVAAEAAEQTINDDKATFVRRFRFLVEPNPEVEARGQPWHRFVVLQEDNAKGATYQRYYTGEKDGLDGPAYDQRYRNQQGSVLCVNTPERVAAASRVPALSRLTMAGGCAGNDRNDMWDNQYHRWFPEQNWPFPGL